MVTIKIAASVSAATFKNASNENVPSITTSVRLAACLVNMRNLKQTVTSLRMPKILVVEDEQMLARIIGMKIEEEGFQVVHAYDGEEAFNQLTQPVLPDLVLLDVLLPKMSGFDVLQKLRDGNHPLPKVIVFSNFAQKADVERAHALGAVDYIVKAAFSPAEILGKIKSVFEQAQSLRPTMPAATAAPTQPAPPASPYQSFASMQDVMPMSEVLRPGQPNNNP
jgi:DNA-binding response OmpR family regulator